MGLDDGFWEGLKVAVGDSVGVAVNGWSVGLAVNGLSVGLAVVGSDVGIFDGL